MHLKKDHTSFIIKENIRTVIDGVDKKKKRTFQM
jgi:3-methyladenine DNA glycosylase AlkC